MAVKAEAIEECAASVEDALATCTSAGMPVEVLDGLLDVLRLLAEINEKADEHSTY